MASSRRIGVLMGGLSSERDLSLLSGEAVYEALSRAGHEVVRIYVDAELDITLRAEHVDVAFLALHGRYGEDGCVQGLLELLGIPYTGPSLLGAALATDKVKTKELLRLHNLPTPSAYVHRVGAGSAAEQHGNFGFPVVVKPRAEGSSLGVQRVATLSELETAIDEAARFDEHVVVERYVRGCEVHVALLDGRALGLGEVASEGPIFDFHARRGRGAFSVFSPPRLSSERQRGVIALAERTARALECGGLVEVDVIVSDLGNEQIIEVDALPALRPDSMVGRIARVAGLDFAALCERIVEGARVHAPDRRRGALCDRRRPLMWNLPNDGVERRAGGQPH
jgi:D-alanine-D-alanine ligase